MAAAVLELGRSRRRAEFTSWIRARHLGSEAGVPASSNWRREDAAW